MKFKTTPVVFIKITGTFNSANEVFHLVHFESPAKNGTLVKPEQDASDSEFPVVYGVQKLSLVNALPIEEGEANVQNAIEEEEPRIE